MTKELFKNKDALTMEDNSHNQAQWKFATSFIHPSSTILMLHLISIFTSCFIG